MGSCYAKPVVYVSTFFANPWEIVDDSAIVESTEGIEKLPPVDHADHHSKERTQKVRCLWVVHPNDLVESKFYKKDASTLRKAVRESCQKECNVDVFPDSTGVEVTPVSSGEVLSETCPYDMVIFDGGLSFDLVKKVMAQPSPVKFHLMNRYLFDDRDLNMIPSEWWPKTHKVMLNEEQLLCAKLAGGWAFFARPHDHPTLKPQQVARHRVFRGTPDEGSRLKPISAHENCSTSRSRLVPISLAQEDQKVQRNDVKKLGSRK